MKKLLLRILAVFIFLFVFSLSPVYAQNGSQIINLPQDQVINHDYFAAGETVNISGTVNGDAYVAGGNVTFNGVVNGDLIAAGGNLTILGKVNGNIRAAGGNLIVSSDIARNATLLGGSISLNDSGKIAGSLVSAGGNISIYAPVTKGAYIAGGQAVIGNKIGETLNAYTPNLTLTPSATIGGDLNYWSERKMDFNPEASISGAINYHYANNSHDSKADKALSGEKAAGAAAAGSLMFSIYSFLVSFLIGLFLIKLFPVFSSEVVKTLQDRTWTSLGIGFLTIILFPLVFILLLITVIGIPLAFALLIAIVLLWFISETFIAIFIGEKVLRYFRKGESSKLWQLFTGLVILSLLSMIPILNFFAGFFTYIFGMGAFIIQKRKSYLLLRKKDMI